MSRFVNSVEVSFKFWFQVDRVQSPHQEQCEAQVLFRNVTRCEGPTQLDSDNDSPVATLVGAQPTRISESFNFTIVDSDLSESPVVERRRRAIREDSSEDEGPGPILLPKMTPKVSTTTHVQKKRPHKRSQQDGENVCVSCGRSPPRWTVLRAHPPKLSQTATRSVWHGSGRQLDTHGSDWHQTFERFGQ